MLKEKKQTRVFDGHLVGNNGYSAKFAQGPAQGKVLAFRTPTDSLYEELELRYGGGFAQWVIDGLDRQRRTTARA